LRGSSIENTAFDKDGNASIKSAPERQFITI
jgi:hypothetical protein